MLLLLLLLCCIILGGQHNAVSLLYYLCPGSYVSAAVYPFVCLSVCEQDHAKSSQAIFMKPPRITEYFYGVNC